VKRNLDFEVQKKIDELIRKSLITAFHDYPELTDYVKDHAQAMDETVMRQHIELYVNDFSVDLGEKGKKAISHLYTVYSSHKKIIRTLPPYKLFVL
jgi:1,4-dihydroxy-6-naphthoate synthase